MVRVNPGLLRRRGAEARAPAPAAREGTQVGRAGQNAAPEAARVNPAALHRRDQRQQVLWCLLSGGLYAFYWYYATYREMLEYRGLKENVGWWFTLLLIGHLTLPIPIILLYAWWKYAQVFQEFAGGDNKSALRTFAMFCLLPPLAWATVQSEINRRANRAPVKPLIFDRSFGYAFVCPIAGALGGALVGLAVALIIGGELAEIGQIKLWPDFSAADDADVLAAVWPLTSIFTGALFGALLGTFMGARAVHQSGSSRIWRGLAVGVLVCAAIATSGAFTFMVYLEQVPHPFGF